ncbi:MAG: flagellar basal body P-ring formation chaperone FlgA [Desulfobacterales bacterium]
MRSREIVKHIKRVSACAAALALVGAAAAAWGAGPTSVRVFDRVEVESDQIFLGAIARIDGDDAGRVRELQELVVGRAPLPGKSRVIDEASIRMRLRQSGFEPDGVDLQVPGEVQISRGALELGGEHIREIVTAYIREQLRDRGIERVQVKEIRGVEAVVLPKGRLSWHVSAPRSGSLTGSVPLAVVLRVNEDFERRLNVTAQVEVRVKAVVSSRPLGRYKPIEEGDIEVREVDLAGLPADFISDPEAVIGKRTRRAVDTHAVLRPDLVELPPVVKRGDRVKIVAETAGMRITAVGEVKQKGCVGERVPVVNLDSNKVVHARVVDGQTVQIEF